jgi:aminomethyltransferase
MSRRTPLYGRHLAAGGRMVDFAGWEMPQQYSSVRAEQAAVRQAAGLFDVSHMGRATFGGEGVADYLQGLVTNDLGRIGPGHAQYNLMCREDGGVLDDLILYRSDSAWTVVFNAGNREKDLAWMRDHLPAGVTLTDRSDEVGLLALQGPKAEEVLQPLTEADLAQVPYFGYLEAPVAGATWGFIARTGYTGEDGFELFVRSEELGRVWDAVLEAGAPSGVLPAGLAARDVCRLEAGLRLYGNDMDEQTNPYEAGLGWVVKLDKGDFVGRQALARVKEEGPARVIVGLRCGDRTIPRHDAAVTVAGEAIGKVTSGTYSFFLNAGIGMASVRRDTASVGSEVEIESRGGEGKAEVVKLPFYKGTAGTRGSH